jgi:hypothetical protein
VSGLFTKAELGPAQPRVIAEDVVIGRGLHSRSLEAVAPDVAAQWDAAKNGAPALTDVTGKSNKKFWFKCDAGPDHEWESTLGNRMFNGQGCPCCSGRKLSVTNSLATVAPEVAAQWHATKNGDTTPADVVAGSDKKYWFTCDAGPDHEWESALGDRVSGGQGCPCCAGKKVSVTNSLATVAPEVAAQWHATKNGDTTPADVVANTNKKYWFTCDVGPDHEWEATLTSRVSLGRGCPCCSVPAQKLSVTNSLATVAPEVAAQWHATKNGDTTPADVTANANKKYWFKCDAGPDHEWEAMLGNRVNGGQGCACCAGKKVSVTNSLASLKPVAAAMWDHEANSPLTPSCVVAGSTKVFGFVDGGGRPFERALRQFRS